MFLVDTMVLSEWSKTRPNPAVMAWFASIRFEDAFLSVVTIGEIERGIGKIERQTGAPSARHLAWLDETLTRYGRRVLPVSTAIARRWGRLSAQIGHSNTDLLIAATALEHDLVVATRNTRHFAPTGAQLLNPYDA